MLPRPPRSPLFPYTTLFQSHEWEHRKDRKITRFIKQANFRQSASLADINYTQSRNLDKNMFRSEEHTSELQSRGHLVCRLLLEKKKKHQQNTMFGRERTRAN